MKKIISAINKILVIVLLILLSKTCSNHFFNTRLVEVPNVMGLNKNDAIEALKKLNLGALLISSKNYDVPLNYVFAQNPKPNSVVKENRAITLYINDNDNNKFPNIIGLSLAEAQNVLNENGIDIERIDYISSMDTENTVISIYPDEKSRIDYGARISLLVTTQKLENHGKMPNVIGLDIKDAAKILSKQKLNVKKIEFLKDSMIAQNIVLDSNPKPDEKLNSNDVILFINEPQIKITQDEIEKIIRESVGE